MADYLVGTNPVAAEKVGDALTPILLDYPTRDHPYAELPIHLIGHSRGASVVSELAGRLAQDGIWVDQLTTLDPHPITAADPINPLAPLFADAPVQLGDNIVFADDYWRVDDPLEAAELVPPANTLAAPSAIPKRPAIPPRSTRC